MEFGCEKRARQYYLLMVLVGTRMLVEAVEGGEAASILVENDGELRIQGSIVLHLLPRQG